MLVTRAGSCCGWDLSPRVCPDLRRAHRSALTKCIRVDFLKKQHLHDWFLLVPPRSSPDKADGSWKDISEAGILVKASSWLPAIASQIRVPS